MIVLSDSTPLISLMKAHQLSILEKLYGEVLIPDAVFTEVTTNPKFPDESEEIQGASFIHVVHVDNQDHVAYLQRITGLDLGESEAIVYTDEQHADLLLVDEDAARTVAVNMGLSITGSVGMMVKACQLGYVTVADVEKTFEIWRKTKRHISERLMRDALSILTGD